MKLHATKFAFASATAISILIMMAYIFSNNYFFKKYLPYLWQQTDIFIPGMDPRTHATVHGTRVGHSLLEIFLIFIFIFIAAWILAMLYNKFTEHK